MKNIIFAILILIASSGTIHAQLSSTAKVATGNLLSHLAPGSNVNVTISAPQKNVVYVGIDNPISIAIPGMSSDEFVVEVSDGSDIVHQSSNNWILRPKKPGTITLRCVHKADRKEIASKKIVVKSLPAPKPYLHCSADNSKLREGLISKSMLSQSVIKFDIDGVEGDCGCQVLSFTLSTNIKGYDQKVQSPGEFFSGKDLQLINNLPNRSIVVIENIMVQTPAGKAVNVGSLSFTLK
ncbi:MAG: hypothetical protein K6F33_14530 [Bacteroidales bacterium]|nr:hypothetical protein [Bacteroidales bacterium]